jgi:ribosome biogenesis GTPase
VTEIRGRRVRVADGDGERVCFLAGHRVVVGDRVRWIDVPGSGGKITAVDERQTALVRVDHRGKEQVLAANLSGILVVVAGQEPPFRPGLIDRYLVAGASSGLRVAVCINKADQGVPAEAEAEIALREKLGVRFLRTSALLRYGLDDLQAFLAEETGPWALVGHSGVGKTSLIGALLPGVDVGAVGELSEYWGTGQHTTTSSRLFSLPRGGEIADSPGIRTFTPGGITVDNVRRFFPGMEELQCKYRDCQHRQGEDGCAAEDAIEPALLASYRRLLEDVRGVSDRSRKR